MRRAIESRSGTRPSAGGGSQCGTVGRVNEKTLVHSPAGEKLRVGGDVFEVHAPRQGHGSARSGKTQRACVGGLTPTDAADVNRVVGARRQTIEFVSRIVGDDNAVHVGT